MVEKRIKTSILIVCEKRGCPGIKKTEIGLY